MIGAEGGSSALSNWAKWKKIMLAGGGQRQGCCTTIFEGYHRKRGWWRHQVCARCGGGREEVDHDNLFNFLSSLVISRVSFIISFALCTLQTQFFKVSKTVPYHPVYAPILVGLCCFPGRGRGGSEKL